MSCVQSRQSDSGVRYFSFLRLVTGATRRMHSVTPALTRQHIQELASYSWHVEAVVYLIEARHVTGEVLHVDAGAHNGQWSARRWAEL